MINLKRDGMIDWTSLSAVSSSSTDAAIKLLIAIVMSYEYDYDADMRRKVNGWYRDSKEFFSKFNINSSEVEKAVKGIGAGKDPDEDVPMHEAIVEIMYQIEDSKNKLKSDLSVSKTQLAMINNIRLYMIKESEAALKAITKGISHWKDPDLNEMFTSDVADTSDIQEELRKLVRKHTGKEGTVIPVDILTKWQEHNKAKGSKLKDHEKYLALNRTLRAEFNKYLETLVRSSGKLTMLVSDVIRECDSNGVAHNLPESFIGHIDDRGKFYTLGGLKLRVSPSGDVRMNANYDNKQDNAYVCEFKPKGGKDYLRAYTEEYTKKAKQKNFKLVSDVVPRIKSLSVKWLADLTKAPKTRNSVLAAVIEFMYETGARVGGKGSESKGNQTYGATQIRIKHVIKIDDNMVHIRYRGKSAGLQNHVLKFKTTRLKKLGKALKALHASKDKEDYLFSFQGMPFSSAQVKRYMNELGFPVGWSAKKLRTAKGTLMIDAAIKKAPFKKGSTDWTEKEVHQWLEKHAISVGAQLGHSSGEKVTPNTAIQNYIDPSIIMDFYHKLGIRPSAKFQKAIDAAT